MKKSLSSPENNEPAPVSSEKLVFPDSSEINAKTLPTTLEQILLLSEEMLPFENQRRQPSPAALYTPFVLKG